MASSRRDFLKAAAAGLGVSLAPWLAYGGDEADVRPNIVLVLADDLSWNDLGFMGSPCAKTPNLDRIAAQGAVFDRLYTCTSVCAPSRFQLNTGRMPAFGSIFGNNYRGLDQVKKPYDTLPSLIQRAGYEAAIAGKRHLPDEKKFPEDAKLFNYTVLSPEYGPEPSAVAAEFLGKSHDRPFLLYVGQHEPHVPWVTTGSVTYDPAALTLPPYMPDTPAIRKVLAEYYGEVTALDDKVGEMFDALQASSYANNTLFLFFTEQGSQIPRGKISCNEIGVRAAMVAWWPGKIEPGRRCEALMHYVDVMPTLLDLVGASRAQGVDGKSFLPVLMGKSDQFRKEVYGAYGKDRSVGTRKWKYIWTATESGKMRGRIYARAIEAGRPLQGPKGASRQSEAYMLSLLEAEQAGSTDPRVKLILDWTRNPAKEELYDLETDPYELNNLLNSDDPPAEVLVDMRRRLGAWLDEQHGPLAADFKDFLKGR